MTSKNMAMTLEELKAQNEAEAAEPETIPQIEPETVEQTTEDEGTVEPLQVAEPSREEALPETLESWQDSGEAEAEKTFTGNDIAAARRKEREKSDRRHNEENSKLQAEIDQLRQAGKPANGQKPKREDFYDQVDSDEAYLDALSDWKIDQKVVQAENRNRKLQAAQFQEQQQQATSQRVNQHYANAEKLIAGSNISAEMYATADQRVRNTIEAMVPGGGDAITERLIADLGEGSEKVFYNLGVNKQRMSEFVEKFKSDQTGIQAAMYLGRLQSKVGNPQTKKTTAPAPAPSINGDANGDQGKAANEFKKRYDSAHSKKDAQSAFNARADARSAGVDVSSW